MTKNILKIAMIIAFRDFRDAEYFIPKQIFENAGIKVITASTDLGVAIGADGGDTKTTVLIDDLIAENFDALVFICGPGMAKQLNNEKLQEIARQGKIVGAICIAPVILAKAGILQGKKATVWSSTMDKNAIKTLKENGAIYEDKTVVADGNIVTANGPEAAEGFAKVLTEILK